MEQSKAFSLLGLTEESDREAWTDALDQAVFQVRDHFMRSPIIPKLYEAKVDRCVLLSDAASTLGMAPLGQPVSMPKTLPLGGNLEALVQGHVDNLMRCRNVLATTLDPDSVAQLGHLMIRLQTEYMQAFMAMTSSYAADDAAQQDSSPGLVPAKQETDWKSLLGAVRSTDSISGTNPLLADLVRYERARMTGIMQTTSASHG
jgi:hypothetical protein